MKQKDIKARRGRYLLTLLLLFAAIGLQAQELTVKSFGVAPGDLDARSSTTQRTDRNGTPCALVKVQLPLQGAQFDGVVGDVQFKAGTYWAYLPNGAYLMSISHPQFHRLDLNLRTLRPAEENFRGVEQLTTYNLIINVPQTGQMETRTQKLIINYTPIDAMVLIDSKPSGENGKAEADLPLGEHSYMIAAKGFITAEGTVKLNGGRQRVLPVELEKDDDVAGQTATTASPTPSTAITPTVQQPAADAPKLTFTVGNVSFTMIRVDGGTFTMGATAEQESEAESDEQPAHGVTLSTYYIGETEVTQALWQAVMGNYPSYFTGNDKRPVEWVSWNDCQVFISRLNSLTGHTFRLPTEAEWEYAARGGNKSRHYKYSGSNRVGSVAWYDGNSGDETHPVKAKQPNVLGLYDMNGNVWEWCNDWYGVYFSSTQTNPKGAATGSGRVLRGGSWYSSARYCRVSYRDYNSPSSRCNYLGLRLAL